MKSCRIALACCVLLATGSIATADDRAVKVELEKLKGEWTVVSFSLNGTTRPVPKDSVVVTITGNKMTTNLNGATGTGTISIDLAVTPKHFDYVADEGDEKGVKRPGIYELKGDDLKICFATSSFPLGIEVDAQGKLLKPPTYGERPKTFDEKSAMLLNHKRKFPSKQ